MLESLLYYSRYEITMASVLDHRLRAAVQEHQLGKQFFFQAVLLHLPNQKDVQAKLHERVHIWQLVEHDSVRHLLD